MSSDSGILGFLTSPYIITHHVNMILVSLIYDDSDNSGVNKFTLVSFTLSPYFDRDGIHTFKNCTANI